MKKAFFHVGFAVVAALSLAACGGDDDVTEEVTARVDCAEICSTYSTCVAEIDVTACTGQCEEMTDANPSVRQEANVCEDCLNDRSCQEIENAGCFNNCPVVPVAD